MRNLKSRFHGKDGKIKLIEEISHQIIVNGDIDLAKVICKNCNLYEYSPNDIIFNQGDTSNDLYFIIIGSVRVYINDRLIRIRRQGIHIGEIAAIDNTKNRTASIISHERTLMCKISEINFKKIANKFPNMWRRIAVEISNRLDERNLQIKPSNSQPVIFIASSSEKINLATHLYNKISIPTNNVKLWDKDVFNPSNTTIDDLIKISIGSDFCFIFFTPDDISISRGKKKIAPRDNLIFELGLFMGTIGRERTFIIKPKGVDIKIPSDLFGLTCYEYNIGKIKDKRSISNIAKKIIKLVAERGAK